MGAKRRLRNLFTRVLDTIKGCIPERESMHKTSKVEMGAMACLRFFKETCATF